MVRQGFLSDPILGLRWLFNPSTHVVRVWDTCESFLSDNLNTSCL